MTRVIAGNARGRRLAVPPKGTRPTSDRAREGLFSALVADLGSFAGLSVVDLYAGSGALGLEALSRGAVRVDLVEQNPLACRVIEQNIATVSMPGATCHQRDVARWLEQTPSVQVHVAFLDPPYNDTDEQVHRVLVLLDQRGHLVEGALAVVERPARGNSITWPSPFQPVKDLRYGETRIWIGSS